MSSASALKAALVLLHMPSGARAMRKTPLPSDTHVLLQIAAGDAKAIDDAMIETGRAKDVICAAATFFIEQVLWHPRADSYRVLGASPDAQASELKRNMSLLMMWLHPDAGPANERAAFVTRVTSAWNDLKTQERRDIYKRKLALALPRSPGKVPRKRAPSRTTPRLDTHSTRPRLVDRLLSFLRGSAPG